MASRESRAVVRGSACRRRQSKEGNPPSMSDVTPLRIVLLGKSVSENSEVGNFLLGRAAFDSEAPPDVVERVGGRLKDRHVTIINSPQLLQTNISDHQITQTVRECVNLFHPGPHVIVLLLKKHDQCSAEDHECVEKVLDSFSERVYQHTMVLTTQEPTETNDILQKIIQKCFNRHFSLQRSSSPDDLLQVFEDIVKMNDGQHLDCAEGSQYFTMKKQATERLSECVKLNLVVCGSDRTLKSSISEQILRDVELHGRQISLVELPALSRLSEDEVMPQAHLCVSLHHPGVHVFLLIVPDTPLTDEDKAEMMEIQRIFSSRINKHMMILMIKDKHMTSQMNLAPSSFTETSIQTFGCRCFVLENSSQVPALLQDMENMVKINNGSCYTTFMFLQAQVELERSKHRAEIEELRRSMMKTAGVIHNDLRIVLLGKTGVGKSATGNTILRRQAFKSTIKSNLVTRECQKETIEFNRRRITVIDTPGLFDTGVDNVEIRKEIVKCVSMAAPGPHVFLLVIQLGRFTQEEKDAVKMIQETFGDQSRMYTMVLFTRGDELRETTIEYFIEGDGSLQTLVQQFGHRYHVFNNTETEDQKQVSELLDKIDCMVAANGGSFYTSEMFQQVEKNIKEEQERIMKEKEKEIKRKEEELKTIYEAEMEQMKKENKRERQEMQNELRKSEEEFKKKEEEIKKEKDENLQKELQRKLEEQQKLFEEENKRKEKALGEQQQNFIKYLEEKHEKEKQKLQEKIQRETREQAEREYLIKLERDVATALKEKYKTENTEAFEEEQEEQASDCNLFTSEMFQLVEKNIKEEKERIMEEKEEEIKRKEEELKTKYEAEIEQMKKENERERQEMQNELRKREEEFKKREEEIKKEKDENLQKELQKKLEEKQKQFKEEKENRKKNMEENHQERVKQLKNMLCELGDRLDSDPSFQLMLERVHTRRSFISSVQNIVYWILGFHSKR